jgi:ubiquitin carboxyl-terminal hydrolase 20/33
VVHADKNATSKAFKKLVDDVWGPRGNESSYVAPANVLFAVKTAYPMFRGFHQHDTQVKWT